MAQHSGASRRGSSAGQDQIHLEPMPVENVKVSVEQPPPDQQGDKKGSVRYAGFVAGIASGWTKLIIGHPFDTIKTRMQVSPHAAYGGAIDCLVKTVRFEGFRKLYAGASVPALGWSVTDGILMGSLHNYRRFLLDHGFAERQRGEEKPRLSLLGHSIAGACAGWTNAGVAHPVETIKCKLQQQRALSAAARPAAPAAAASAAPAHALHTLASPRAYSTVTAPAHAARETFTSPIDVVRQTVRIQGIGGMWRGFGATLIFRSSFACMFGGFELFNRMFQQLDGTPYALSKPMANFLAGGLASNLYWITALPWDNVKNRIMADKLAAPRYANAREAFRSILHENDSPSRSRLGNWVAGGKNFYRGIVPVFLRAAPANAAALMVWEAAMRALAERQPGL